MPREDTAIIGAGPIGLEIASELKRAGLPYVHFDKGQIGSTIQWFPEGMTFFSSNDRIAIAGIPIQTVDQGKCSKEAYLAYLRQVAASLSLEVRTFEEVTAIERAEGGFRLTARGTSGTTTCDVRRIVLATGDMARPRRLEIEGEDLPHVSHYLREPHTTFRRRVLIVGGKNSAVEAALRCYHAGAHVAISYRRTAFDERHVKYWLLPELNGRIERDEIRGHLDTQPTRILADAVELRSNATGETFRVPADHVYLLTGHVADMRLFRQLGVTLTDEREVPWFDPDTMETDVPGVYVAGTATAGTQPAFTVFLENCHVHAQRIVRALLGEPPPSHPGPVGLPES